MINLSGQFYLLIHTLLYGAYLALMADLIQISLKRIKKTLLRQLLIGLFLAFQLPLILLYFHQVNRGVFQGYLLVFIFVGSLFYRTFLRRTFLKQLAEVVDVSRHIYMILRKSLTALILRPLAFTFSGLVSRGKKDKSSVNSA